MKKRMIFFLTVLLLLGCIPITVFAHEVPDLDEKGSIEITMMMGDQIIPGGKLICTRVGYIHEEDGDSSFRCLDGKQITDVSSRDAAREMVEFVKNYQKAHPVSKEEKSIGKDGKVKFSNLETGLYLITQEDPPSGYYAISPFLVSVPNNEDGHYVYDVVIHSKTESEKPSTVKPSTPSKPTDSKLPQTGQITWPIPVLIAAGLLLLVLGFLLRGGKNNDEV